MNKEYLNVFLVDKNDENISMLKDIFCNIKIGVKLLIFPHINQVKDYLDRDDTFAPELLMMNYDVFKKDLNEVLQEVKKREKLHKVITAVYSEDFSDPEMEDFFVLSGNIFIKKEDNYMVLKKKIVDVITVSWQFYTSGLNKDNFILKI